MAGQGLSVWIADGTTAHASPSLTSHQLIGSSVVLVLLADGQCDIATKNKQDD